LRNLKMCQQSRPAKYAARGFAMVGPAGDIFPLQSIYRLRVTPQRNSLVKLNTGAAG
jgi:hypothetical protein